MQNHFLVVVLHDSKLQHLACQFFPGDVQLCLKLDDFVCGIDVMPFCLDFFAHFLLSFRHEFSDLLHVEIWNLSLLFVGPYLLYLIRKEYGELRAIELVTVLTIIVEVLFVYFFDELSLH